jgi:DNA-binding CsgD family transcriptional regulator
MVVLGEPTGVIGRAAELERVTAFVDRLRSGPASLLVHGEAGIGKTSVWRAGIERAARDGLRILRSAPAESEQGLILGGLTDLLRDVPTDELAVLPGVQSHALEVALLRASDWDARATDADGSGAAATPMSDQRTLSVATAGLLAGLAARSRIVIAIDDAQWLDETSAAIVAYAVRRLTSAPVGLLLAVRGSPLPRIRELLASAPAERRDEIDLGPMPLAALHQLFLERLGRSFPRLVLVRIEEASAGNPLYALEIARELARSGAIPTPGGPLPIPDSLGSLLESRIEALPRATRDALAFAAIATEPTVERLDALEHREPIEAALEPARAAGIVTIDAGTIRFAHPLLAQAVIATTSPAELRRAHAALARTARTADARARHLAGATDGPSERVAEALETAASGARSRGAALEAAALYGRAVDLTPETRRDAALRRATLAGETLFVDIGEVVHAEAILQRAVAAAPPGPLRAETLSLRALLRYYHGDTPDAVRLGELAIAEVGAGTSPDDRIRRATVIARAAFLVMQLDLARGHELIAVARALLDPPPPEADPDLIANVLLLHASSALGLVKGYLAEEIERGLSLMNPAGRSWEHDGADGIAFGLARTTDDLARAIAMTEELIRVKSGPSGDDPFNLVQLSGLQVLSGDLAGARASAEAAAEGYAREGADVFPAWRLRGLALVAAHEGRHAHARSLAAEGLDLAVRSGDLALEVYHRHILGFVALADGEAIEAYSQLERAAEVGLASGTLHPGRFKLDGDRLEAALAVGDGPRADEIATYLEHVVAVAPTPWTRVMAARGRSLVAAAGGDLDAALASLEAAIQAHAALPMPFERARSLLVLGQLHRRRKAKRLADEAIREALGIFEQLGTRAWADRARNELGRIGLRPHAPAGLTETEQRVAELAATGLSSREIGDRVFLAPKTVGNVLGRVYEKLGIHSRAELGARLGAGAGAHGGASAGDRSG